MAAIYHNGNWYGLGGSDVEANPTGSATDTIEKIGIDGDIYAIEDADAVHTSDIGTANGVAELDANGLVPSSQLPSYVDDVLEYASVSAFPATGETGKIYVALDTNLTYRWSGSAYVEISPSLALGETSSTAYRGDRGKTAYDHATESGRSGAKSAGLYKIGVTAQGHVASATAVAKSDLTALGVADQNDVDAIEADIEGFKTVTGKYITITDGAELPAKNYSITISPVQEGSGDPSPTNVRPIHGADEVGVRVCGKNFLGLTIDDFDNPLDYGLASFVEISLPNGTYTISSDAPTGYIWIGDTWLGYDFATNKRVYSGQPYTFTVTDDSSIWIGIATDNKQAALAYNTQIEKGETATEYEAFNGHSTTITLPSTVYGGSVEQGGSGTSEIALVNDSVITNITEGVDGNADWLNVKFTTSVSLLYPGSAEAREILAAKSKSNYSGFWVYQNVNGQIHFYSDRNAIYAFYPKSVFPTLSDFTTYYASNKAEFAIPLATPTSLSLTPFPQTLLEGVNNVWAEMVENSTVIDNAQQALSYQPQNIVGQLRQEIEAKPDSFAQLSDTSFSNLANGQIPKWNSTSQKWENANESGGGGASSLAELSDTNISSPADGQILKWDGTLSKWVNANEYSYTLPTASANTLGGIKVGSGLSINNSGVLSALGIEYYTHTEDITISSAALVTATMLSDVPAGKYMVFVRYQSPANNNSAVYLMAMLYNNDTDSVVFMSGQELASSVISMYFVIDISATSTIKLQIGTSSYDPAKTLKDVNVTAIKLP